MIVSPELIDILLKAGPTGIVVLLYSLGWIYPKPAMTQAEKEIEYLKQALAEERAAHATTRGAHAEKIQASLSASHENAQTTIHLLTDLKERKSEAPR